MAHFIITTKPYVRSDGTSQVIIRYTYSGKHFTEKIPNLYCRSEELDISSQMITKGYSREVLKQFNTKLNEIKARGNTVLMNLDEPNPELFFKKLFTEPKKAKKQKTDSLIELYKQWLDKEVESPSFATVLPLLINFRQSRGGNLEVQEYGKNLLKEFERYLLDTGYILNQKRKNTTQNVSGTRVMYKHSTVKKNLKYFKYFGKYLADLELPIKQNFRDYRPTISSPSIPDAIALTKAEFDQLFYWDLSNTFELNLVKSAFIIGTASGGMRISDLYALTKQNFDAENFTIHFTQQKTGGDVFNPLSKEYIEPHLNFFLENLHNMPVEQEFNRKLKKIGNLIGWKREEITNEYRGKDKKPSKVKIQIKDHISSKYMRKTFISILVELGYSKELIKGFTGHKDDKIVDHYIQLHEHSKRKVVAGFKPEH